MTLGEWQARLGAWQRATFGEKDGLEAAQALHRKLGREVGELMAALYSPDRPARRAAEELADVVILALSMAERLGVDLEAAVRDKHAENLGRRWARQDDGTFQHVSLS